MTLQPKYFMFFRTRSPPQIRCIPIGEHQTILHPQENFPDMPPFKIEPGPWFGPILLSFRCRMFCEGLSHRVSWLNLALGLSFDFPSMPKNVPNRASPIFFKCASRQYGVEVRGLGSRGDPRTMSCEFRRVPNYIP